MPIFNIDPFKDARKNAHIWRGENTIIWYNEKLDGSFTVLTLYDFGDKKRRIYLEVNENNQKVEFKNDELNAEQYGSLLQEIYIIEKFLTESRQLSGSLPF
jgi:hypothetical protein